MLIATFNINTINKRLPNLLRWLKSRRPDIVCLQELKCAQGEFPQEAIREAGYHAVWRGERAWNGVAILSKYGEPIVTRTSLPGDPADRQSRYIEAAVDGILIGCLYLPNGNPQPGPKFDYKLKWMSRLRAHAKKLLAQKVPLILAGDFNVAPTEIDIYPTTSWDDDALIQPAPRAAYKKLVDLGFTDALRSEKSRRARLHLLALHAKALRARRGPAARSSPHFAGPEAALQSRRRRPHCARRARRKRSRAGVGGGDLRNLILDLRA